MYADSFMNTLLDMTDFATDVSIEEHGERLAMYFLAIFGGDYKYYQFLGITKIHKLLERSH